jgi:hypothetical protein
MPYGYADFGTDWYGTTSGDNDRWLLTKQFIRGLSAGALKG